MQEIKEISNLLEQLFPICRSITGDGVRQTLSILKEKTDFEILEIPTGIKCYDWTIPKEWNVIDAYVKDSNGNKIIDFQKNNLHLKSYSVPINKVISFKELNLHLETLPDMPDAIPYRTTYYKEDWGFCISYNQYINLNKNSNYEVVINTSLKNGYLTYGEKKIKGKSKYEFLISTYCCHPSLANDNLSGIVLWILLLRWIKQKNRKHNYRFVIAPETIGAIAYLSKNESEMKKVLGGFILTCVAGPRNIEYKKSFLGNHFLDEIVLKKFDEIGLDYKTHNFDINGSDERQFSSPFYRIPIGTICKSKYYEYDNYHTSKDNLDYVKSSSLLEIFKIYTSIIEEIESMDDFPTKKKLKANTNSSNQKFLSLMPFCEPMLSKRNLYPTNGGTIKQKQFDSKKEHKIKTYQKINEKNITGEYLDIIKWIMFYSDGKFSLTEIAQKINIPLEKLLLVANDLCEKKLLKIIDGGNGD